MKLDKNQYNLTVNDIQRIGGLKLIKGTDIMRLSVSFENPEIVAEIANTWASEFLKHFSVIQLSKFQDQLRQSLEFKEKELNIIRNKINQYHSDNNGDQNLSIAGLIGQELQSELTIFSLHEVSAKMPNIGEILQEATVPSHPSTNKVKILLIAFVVGLFLSIFIAFFTEYIQNAIAKGKV